MKQGVQAIGHRGARGLFPENTLEGFLAAAALGITAFELDVGLTADGVPVVCHDPALNPDLARGLDGAWLNPPAPLIRDLTLAQLATYDVGRMRPRSRTAALFPHQHPLDGARVPALETVLTALPSASFIIEVKTHPAHPDWTAAPSVLADAVLTVIDRTGTGKRVTVEAFDWRVQTHIKRLRQDIRLAWLTRTETVRDYALWWDGFDPASFGGSVPTCVAAAGGPTWAPEHTGLTQADISQAHDLGLSVLPWTVNARADMLRLSRWGADGLISDFPDTVLALSKN